jgi:hypothetical protein
MVTSDKDSQNWSLFKTLEVLSERAKGFILFGAGESREILFTSERLEIAACHYNIYLLACVYLPLLHLIVDEFQLAM